MDSPRFFAKSRSIPCDLSLILTAVFCFIKCLPTHHAFSLAELSTESATIYLTDIYAKKIEKNAYGRQVDARGYFVVVGRPGSRV